MADKTITIPKMQHAVLTAGGYTDVEIDDDPEFVEDNFGLTLTSLPSNTQVLVEVQLFIINASQSEEAVFLKLTKSRTDLAQGDH